MSYEWAVAIHGLIAAHTSIIRDTMRHMVEEGLIPPDVAGRIVRDAAERDLPASNSTGETFDAARDELLAIARALEGWPGNGDAPREPQRGER